MEGPAKNRLVVIILAVATLLCSGLAVSSCFNARNQKLSADRIKAGSWDLEQKIGKLTQEKAALEAKLKELNKNLEEGKSGEQSAKKALLQEQMINSSLKEDIKKLNRVQEALEADLKTALATDKATKPKQ
jgi:chromosome segregation ATPase